MTALFRKDRLRAALPVISLLAVLLPIFYLQPRTLSYFGLNLLLNLAVPIVLATIAQMFIITVNDLDLSIGSFVSFVACVGATVLANTGKPFTTSSIGGAIATRAIMADLRAGGDVIGGPAPFSKTDRSSFLSALDAALVRLKRR